MLSTSPELEFNKHESFYFICFLCLNQVYLITKMAKMIHTSEKLHEVANNGTFDTLVNKLELSLLKQLKQSLEKLRIDNNNNN